MQTSSYSGTSAYMGENMYYNKRLAGDITKYKNHISVMKNLSPKLLLAYINDLESFIYWTNENRIRIITT